MIGFLGLMLLLGGVVCLGSYWISWESQDARTRPAFTAKFANDCARLMKGKSTPVPDVRRQLPSVEPKATGAHRS